MSAIETGRFYERVGRPRFTRCLRTAGSSGTGGADRRGIRNPTTGRQRGNRLRPPGTGARRRADVCQRGCADQRHRAAASGHKRLAVRAGGRLYVRDDPALRHHLSAHQRRGNLGRQRAGRVGIRHRQLRLVGRDRPRGHADLGHSAAAQAEVAHQHQPLRRSDDPVRRRLRGPVSR